MSSIYKGTTSFPENPCLYTPKYSIATFYVQAHTMLTHLAAPRLATMEMFFKTSSEKDVLGCYAWNQAVGAGLLPILGDFEVSLRNALHRALSKHYANTESFDWMMQQPNPAHAINPQAPEFLPARHKLTARSVTDLIALKNKIKEKKPAGYIVSPDDIVAALPFGFWEVLISGLSHQSQPAGLQATILAAVFPYAPDTVTVAHGTSEFRKRILNLLKRIRDVRNRIGHHEALWTTPEFNQQGQMGFIPRRPRHTINSLRGFAANICWLAGWIDPSISRYIRNSDHWWSLQALLHRHALVTYRKLGGKIGTYRTILETAEVPRRTRSSPRSLRRDPRERLIADRYHF